MPFRRVEVERWLLLMVLLRVDVFRVLVLLVLDLDEGLRLGEICDWEVLACRFWRVEPVEGPVTTVEGEGVRFRVGFVAVVLAGCFFGTEEEGLEWT